MAVGLTACNSGSTSSEDAVVVASFPIAYVNRDVGAIGNPTNGARFQPGGDLYLRDLSSPSAAEVNVTGVYTQGQGDVSDPEVSYDGERLLFAMRGPNDRTWNIWEYDIAAASLTRIMVDADADGGDDVDPAYLPDGRVVFTSNRQEKSRRLLEASGVEPYAHLDEYERERAMLLHVMNHDGSDIHQISFNQSHDRNPIILSTGEITFSRWDHVGGRNHFPIFFTNPDGTSMFVQYGAFSPGNSFLHPREMPDGTVLSSLMPLSRTREGGALVAINIQDYSENDQPGPGVVASGTGQHQVTAFDIELDRGNSEFGRYTTPYPLWDGTHRALVSWSPFRPVVEVNAVTGLEEEVEGDPAYGIYMLDLDDQTLRPVVAAKEGRALTDAIAVMARPVPNIIPDKALDADLAAEGMGILNVKSVYDNDFLDMMGESVLVDGESVPKTAPPAGDTRAQVTDIARLKDPALTTAAERPARFLRLTRGAPTPPGISRETIGETSFEMQQVAGYAVIEPDGSFKVKVPADTPLMVSVVDADGRAFHTHTNWIQVRPGEIRTCNGCHSPRRGSALNAPPIAGDHPNTLLAANAGESMAETHTRLDPSALVPGPDPVFHDVWTDPVAAGRAPDPDLAISYASLTTPAPVDGIINYPDHIQLLWTVERDGGAATCTTCHDNGNPDDPTSVGLDLRATVTGTGRLLSYEELMVGDPVIDPATGLPELRVEEDGQVTVVREASLVAADSGSGHSSRASHLIEKLYERELRASQDLVSPPTVDHSGFLNPSERRLVAEWIDLGGQYYNDPFDDSNGDGFRSLSEVRGIGPSLDEEVFAAQVHPILMARCASCHQAFGGSGRPTEPANPLFAANRYVLTGGAEGDFNVTITMVNDACTPENSYLLARPVADETRTPPHPRIADPANPDSQVRVLSATAGNESFADYQTIRAWIAAACP